MGVVRLRGFVSMVAVVAELVAIVAAILVPLLGQCPGPGPQHPTSSFAAA